MNGISTFDTILNKALNLETISMDEARELYTRAPLAQLMMTANEIRKLYRNDGRVTWIIDRNVNITNVCVARCKFCNFHRLITQDGTYVTSIDEYKTKIDQMTALGGSQLLLQGGLHPKLGLEFYTRLFSELKSLYPGVKLHALGPAEIHHISRLERMSYAQVLQELTSAGLDSLPGAGAEILNDRVRGILSPGKCSAHEWLEVMREAHRQNITTSATMMFGHIETIDERLQHLFSIRMLQEQKPTDSQGFATFVPWPFQDTNTELRKRLGIKNSVTAHDYVRLVAIARIVLNNVANLQASWLTVGVPVAQVCLHGGANDMGSIMIEENVVSAAGASYTLDREGMHEAISRAGFIPQLRNQKYEYVSTIL